MDWLLAGSSKMRSQPNLLGNFSVSFSTIQSKEPGMEKHTRRRFKEIPQAKIQPPCPQYCSVNLSRAPLLLLRGQSGSPLPLHGSKDGGLGRFYPNSNPVIQHLIGACGYTFGFSCRSGLSQCKDELLALPRIEVRGSDRFQEFVTKLNSQSSS